MANSYQQAINDVKTGLTEINALLLQVKESEKQAITELGNLANVTKGIFSSKNTPNDMGKEIEKLKKEMTSLNNKIKELTDAKQKLTVAQKTFNSQSERETNEIKSKIPSLNQLTRAQKSLSDSYTVLLNRQKKAKENLRNLIVEQGKNSKATRKAQLEYDALSKKINAANKATSNFSKTGLGGMVRGFKNLLSAFGLIGGTVLFANIIKDTFNLTKTLDSISFSMKAVIKDSEELGQTQTWLKDITNAYGAELITTTNRYIKFRAAAQQANFTAEETQKVFATMTKAAGVLGLKTDELQGIYLALEQMISKGKITTEELRRQLGERLPGAMDIMAKSMGVSTSQLDAMMKRGEVITKDVLPAFARQVEIAFGIENVKKVDTLQAATIRLKNAWTNLVIGFNKGNNASKSLRDIIDKLAENLKGIVKTLIIGTKVWLGYKAALILANVQQKIMSLGLLRQATASAAATVATEAQTVATATATSVWTKFNNVLKANALGIAVTALYGIYKALKFLSPKLSESLEKVSSLNKEFIESAKTTFSVTKKTQNLIERYDKLKIEAKDNKDKQKELKEVIQEISDIVPRAKTGIDDYGKALDINRDKVIEFSKENAKLILLRAKKGISDQSVELRKYRKELNNVITAEKTSQMINTESNGTFIMKNGILEKVINRFGASRKATLDEQIAYEEYVVSIKSGIRELEKGIEMDKEAFKISQNIINGKKATAITEKEIDEAEAKRKQEEFDKSLVIDNLKKAVDEAEAKRNEILGIKKEGTQKEYERAVKESILRLNEARKKDYLESVETLEKAQNEYDKFIGEKGKNKTGSSQGQAEREAERRLKAEIRASKASSKAKNDAIQSELEMNLRVNQSIMDDDIRNKKERLEALHDFVVNSKDSVDALKIFEIEQSKLTMDEIVRSQIRTDEEKEAAIGAHKDRLIAIENEYNDNLNKIRQANTKNFERILLSEAKKVKLANEHELALIEQKNNDKQRIENVNYDSLKADLDKSLAERRISQEDYDKILIYLNEQREKEVQRIQRESAIEQLKLKIQQAKVEAALITDPLERQAEYDKIKQSEMELDNLVAENKKKNAEDEIESIKNLQQIKNDIISKSSNMLAEALGIDADNIAALFKKIEGTIAGSGEGIKKTAKGIMETMSLVGSITASVFDLIAERNIQKLDEQIQANNEYYEAILDNELLSEEQRTAIEEQRDAKNKALEQKKKAEQIKQARTAKIFGAFQIAIQTAIATISALAAPPIGLGPVAGVPLAVATAALGAASIAATLAQPIPKFEKGTENAPQGWAMVDEKRPEVHLDKYNRIKSLGHDKPNLRYLDKGDKIIPSMGEFQKRYDIDELNKVVWQLNLNSNGEAIKDYQMEAAMLNGINGMRSDLDIMGRRFEKIAKRPIKNTVKVELEDKRHY